MADVSYDGNPATSGLLPCAQQAVGWRLPKPLRTLIAEEHTIISDQAPLVVE
jgi:hypothetical protein